MEMCSSINKLAIESPQWLQQILQGSLIDFKWILKLFLCHDERSCSSSQSKRRFERDCKEADRAQQYFEKMDADINVTKADVEKVSQRIEKLTVKIAVIGLIPRCCW